MGLKLQGRKFFINENHGVTAIVDELVHQNSLKRRALYKCLVDKYPVRSPKRDEGATAFNAGLGHLQGIPVFTFASDERVAASPWFTGFRYLFFALDRYIEAECGLVQRKPIFVPFSNGAEMGLRGKDPQADELMYVTTEHQFLDTFGITTEQVLLQYPL